MLEIFINNQKVDLPEDIEINLVYENPIFSTDRTPAPYSFDFEIPLTARNLAIAGHPQRITQERNLSPVPAKVFFAGRQLLNGTAKLEPMADAISYSICGALLPTDIKKRLSRQILERWGWDLPADSTPGMEDSLMYNDLLMTHIEDDDFPLVAAPISIKEAATQGGEYVLDKYNILRAAYISPYNTSRKSYVFQCDSGAVYATGNILPAIRVWYMLKALLGERLKRNIFAEGDWKKLVMISTYHPYFKIEGVGAPLRRSLNGAALWLDDIVPNLAANELVTELLKLPCATLYLKGDSYHIEYNKDILTRSVVHDWSGKIIGAPTVGIEPAMSYKFAYANDVPCEIPTYPPMSATSIKNMFDVGYFGYVQVWWPRQTFYCTPANEENTAFTYKVVNHGDSKPIEEVEADDDAPEVYDMETSAEMLINDLYPYVTTVDAGPRRPRRFLYTPQIEAISNKRGDGIYLSLYHGLCPDASNEKDARTYPYICSSNFDCDGKKLGDLSIEQAALYQSYHKPFATWLSRNRLALTVDLLLDVQDVGSLDLRDKFHIRGRNFLIKELRASITNKRISACDADLVEV